MIRATLASCADEQSFFMIDRSHLVLKYSFDQTKLLLAMNTPDHIGAIVRIHNELDDVLKHIVKVMLPPPVAPLQYANERINVLTTNGLPIIRVAPASIINAVRNKFVHNNQPVFKASDVSKLHRSLWTLYGERDFTNFTFIHRTKDADHALRFIDMNDKQKFCFLGFAAIAAIAAIEIEFAHGTFRRIAR